MFVVHVGADASSQPVCVGAGRAWTTAACDLPVARVPCGCGCSRAEFAVGGCRRSAALRGRTPGETAGWGQGSWKGGCGPKPSTSAAAGAGWPGGGPGPPLLLLLLYPTVNTSVWTATKALLESGKKKVLTRCCLLVLLMLDWTGSWMTGRTTMLWRPPLLGLACRGCRGLWVLWVWVQGGTRVWILLRHWPWRHFHRETLNKNPSSIAKPGWWMKSTYHTWCASARGTV